jgi:xanthine dehydrogenase accessory factor
MMHKQRLLWQFIERQLTLAEPVVLLYVLESIGSSPGRQGFGMAVTASGNMCGSIGGGMMEHKLVEVAKHHLATGTTTQAYYQQIHDKAAAKNQSGMICSGEQSVYMYRLQPCDLITVSQIVTTLQQHKHGRLTITPKGIAFDATSMPQPQYSFEFDSEDNFVFTEKIGHQNKVFIVGGGHCALAFSELMHKLGFYVQVIEERPHLNTLQQNHFAHEIAIVNQYSEIGLLIPDGSNHYVVLMTFGYRTDAVALQAVSHKQLAYLGMLGSKNKIMRLLNELEADGLIGNVRNYLRAPIGLPIYSQTPEEIAVSIAAEIILVKNKQPN